MKSFPYLFALLVCSGCGIISKQYDYVPSVPHQAIKTRSGHSGSRITMNKFKLLNRAGDSIGSVSTCNGTGHPLLMGPLVPVIPVGGFFQKSDGRFIMDLAVSGNIKDSLQNSGCYMILNDTLKVPLTVRGTVAGDTHSHSYWLTADIRFRKVISLKLVTGSALLDSTLSPVTFKRSSRIKFDLIGPGY